MKIPSLLPMVTAAASVAVAASAPYSQVLSYTTAKDSDFRLSAQPALTLQPAAQPKETQGFILLDPAHQFQSLIGIGAALTDSAAETFAKLPRDVQAQLIAAYFDRDQGIGYTFARTNIASCDFSSSMYDYVDEGDTALDSFSIALDQRYKIPLIKRALAATDGQLKLFASPWSPPAWMKDNGNRLHGGKLLPAYRDAWARHFVKFVQAYEATGIPVWGLTVQNEPMAVQTWESCVFTADEERDFVRDHLGPALASAGLSDTKLIVWDHNRDQIYQRASAILSDPAAAKYVWGVGFHWYEPWTGGDMQFDNLRQVKESYPDVHLVFTEGCAETFKPERMTAWSLGEHYGHSMVHDFKAGTEAWTDWNLLLNERGGPNHVGNYCFAPVHANTNKGELIFTNSYYYIGHFSKFIQPGARRIASSCSRDLLEEVAFQNPDGTLVLVVMNRTEDAIPHQIRVNGLAADTTSQPHSITTYLLPRS